MIEKTNKTIVLLNFDDPNNPWKDECGNFWKKNGNPILVYDNDLNKYVAVFNRFNKDGLVLNGSLVLGGSDFTIDTMFYLDGSDKKSNTRLFEFAVTTNHDPQLEVNFVMSKDQYQAQLYCTLNNYNGTLFSSLQNYNKWIHFSVTHSYTNKRVSLFMNGIEEINKPVNILKYTFPYCAIGNSIYWGLGTKSSETPIHGKYAFFRIEKDILFTENFHPESLLNNKKEELYKSITKRNIYHLYNISYDSLYKYNINNSLLYNDTSCNIHNKVLYNNDTYRDINKINNYNNDIYRNILKDYIYNNNIYRNILRNYIYNNNTYRDINKINNYNNNTLRNVLYNINSLYNTYRYINKINKYNNITKRNIINNIQVIYNTKRLIHNNINIINYVHRHKVCNGNNISDTVRSVISWKHKIVAFITNPRYRLR